MPQILMPYTVHLDHTLRVTPLSTLFSKGDSAAHRFELTIMRAGKREDLTGCTVMRKFYRMADSTVVSVPGSVEDGKAVVVLDAACYDYIGRFALTISIKKGEEETTVFYGDGYMHGQRADTVISGEYIIYDINTLLEKISEIDAATQAANTATGNANTAASNANTARDAANTAASTANTAANNANTAKDTANAAAAKINAMTVSATPVETGTATAELTTVDGHYHLALGLPKGDTGATPQISVQVATGAAGSEASVSVSGTAENPVIHLTIPRGDVGDIGALTINGKSPDGSGAVTLTPGDLGSASAESVNQLKDDKLDKTATAADSSKLGGKTLAEIMLTLYPVGAVYISAVSTSPASLFGGEWTQINGRFLIGTGAPELNDDRTSPGSYNFAAGSKGGEAEHTLTKLEMPTHYHNAYYLGLGGSSTTPAYYATLNKDSYTYNYENTTPNTATVATTTREGSDVAHNNMPPYIAVYIWKRVN